MYIDNIENNQIIYTQPVNQDNPSGYYIEKIVQNPFENANPNYIINQNEIINGSFYSSGFEANSLNELIQESVTSLAREINSHSLNADIELITDEMANLSLPESVGGLEAFHSNKHDNNIRENAFKAFEQIDEIIGTTISILDKNQLLEIEDILHALSLSYLNASYLTDYHSFDSLSNHIKKMNKEAQGVILSELKALGRLNELTLILKKHLVDLLNYLEFAKSKGYIQDFDIKKERLSYLIDLSEDFFQNIEKNQKNYLHEFFSDPNKSREQYLLQTIKALYANELKKIESCLSFLVRDLKILLNEPEKYSNDLNDPSLSFPSLKDKKVVIFTCSYGTGHKVTASAIKQQLDKVQAKSSIYDLSTGPLLGRDRIRQIFKTFGISYDDHLPNSVDLFNEILRNQLYFLMNTKDKIDLFIRKMLDISGKDGVAAAAGILNNSWEKTQIREILLLERPDHIITTYHMDLNPILEVTEELGIPILHIPTDYNMKCWEVFGQIPPSYPHFKSLVPNYGIEETYQSKEPLTENQIVDGVGIPLRMEFSSFLTQEEARIYRERHDIKDDEKVLYLSAGGNGQNLPHPEFLANSKTWDIPLRIEVIAGKNRQFVEHLQKNLKAQDGNPLLLKGKNPYVTIEIIANPDPGKKGTDQEFFISADEISRILDITDASIAKAGGLSVSELLFKGIPILFDQRKNPFSWELFNIEVAVNQKMGLSNFNLKYLEEDLKAILEIPKNRNENFFFEKSQEILCETIQSQIEIAEQDQGIVLRRGYLISNSKEDKEEIGQKERDKDESTSNHLPKEIDTSENYDKESHSSILTKPLQYENSGKGVVDTAINFVKNIFEALKPGKEKQLGVIASLAAQDISQMSQQELDEDWKLGSYFGEIKVITGNKEGERFKRCRQELASIGLKENDYTVFPGVNGADLDPAIWKRAYNWNPRDTIKEKQGRMGCFMAHYNAIKDSADRLKNARDNLEKLKKEPGVSRELIENAQAEIKKYSSVLIIEDNNGFGKVTGDHTATLEGSGKRMREILQELPDDWDMFYFIVMADDWGPSVVVSQNLLKLKYGVVTKCYAVNAKMYSTILKQFDNVLEKEKTIYPVDHVLASLQKSHKCYAPKYESIAYRFGSVSEVQQTIEIKNWQPAIVRMQKESFWNIF